MTTIEMSSRDDTALVGTGPRLLILSIVAVLSGVLLCGCSADTPDSRDRATAMSSARLVEAAPDAPYLPPTERLEAQLQATLETVFGYTGIVETRCTDLSGTCLVDFEDAPTEVVSVSREIGGTYVGPVMPR